MSGHDLGNRKLGYMLLTRIIVRVAESDMAICRAGAFTIVVAVCGTALASVRADELVDHHQHLISPQALAVFSAPKAITAADLIEQMDIAGIDRAVILSDAYGFSNPFKNPGSDEYARVRAENDWVSTQVATYPTRLIGFCAVDPLRDYALDEIERCSRDPNLSTGLKLHFGNSDVNLDIEEHVERVRAVFASANAHGMSIVVHARANIDHGRPYGSKQAQVFLERLLPAAPDVTVQIAHLASGGGYDAMVDDALKVYAEAIQRRDPRARNLYFDASGIPITGMWEQNASLLTERMRQIGMNRILFGVDGIIPGNSPTEFLERWHKLPLSAAEFRQIESNVAPYLRPASVRRAIP